ncbi:probable ribosomal protein S11, mitochondrial isoform X2 [Vigna unguiculata]|uniref:probable ribosomal protein S11, mitochondrial isoform X2 n=1 Tax=Vigna unguiculata TaxID=3917 RepID=UPI0010170A9A|nr:probable ribosomal protein S11, mitochondrial isoform X2 [Vigna unguiculata]
MYRFFSCIRHGRGSSLVSLLAPKPALPFDAAVRPRHLPLNDGHVRGFSSSNFDWRIQTSQNVNEEGNARPNFMQNLENRNPRNWNNVNQNVNANANAYPNFMQNIGNRNPRMWNNLGQNVKANEDAPPDFMQEKENINLESENDAGTGLNSRPMDFVRGILDGDNFTRGSSFEYQYEQDADHVHIKMLRNNTFVTVTDSKGNVKLSGSAGSLKDLKSGQKLSRYAAEATAEVVGRRSRGLGLKSVVMKVNGFTHFRRKRQAILSWKEGFTADSRGGRNPIVFIEDTTRKPHNGCRLPKKRRI